MDECRANPYVRARPTAHRPQDIRLELLLILSAMLTALTGAMTGTRAAQAQTQQNCTVAVAGTATTARLAVPSDRSWLALAAVWAIETSVPILAIDMPVRAFGIHMDKRRE